MSIARNTLLNVAGIGIPMLVSIGTVPLYLHAIGLERYGIVSICWVALAYFALFDFGVGKALAQRMAALADQPPAERSALFWAGVTTSAMLAVLAAGGAFITIRTALPLIDFTSVAIAREAADAVGWLVLVFPTIILGGALGNTLAARERFLAVNLIEVVSSTLGMVAPVAIAYAWGPELPKLMAMILASRIVAVVALAACCRRAVPVGGFVRPRRAAIGPLLRYGGWVSLSDATTPILSVWDRFAIGAVLGAGSVPLYSIPNTLVTRLTLLPAALSRALFPGLARGTEEEAARIANAAVAGLAAVMTPLCLAMLLGIWPFLYLWIGPALTARVADISYIFVPGLWMNALAIVPYTFTLARRRPRIAALIHLGQLLPYCGLLYLAMRQGGLVGVAILWTVRTAADALLFLRLSGTGMAGLRAAWPGLVLVCLAAATALALPVAGTVRWVLLAALLATGLVHAVLTMPPFMAVQLRRLVGRTAPAADQ